MSTAITLTDSAAQHIKNLIVEDGRADLKLRLGIKGGGCSGFQYSLDLDPTQDDDDIVFMVKEVPVIVDSTSLELIAGTEVDFVEDLMGASFQFRNPHAASTCGCGSSFSV